MTILINDQEPLDLEMFRGDDRQFQIPVYKDGRLADLTGYGLFAVAMYDDMPDGPMAFQLDNKAGGTISNPSIGIVQVDIPSAATASLDARQVKLKIFVRMKAADGSTTTIGYGTLTVWPSPPTW